jgi:hypothetical protein
MILRVMRNGIWLLRHPGFAKLLYSLLLDLLMIESVGPVSTDIRSRLMKKLWLLIKFVQAARRGTPR